MSDRILVFGIPVDAGYGDIARLLSRELKIWIQHGPKDLLPHDRARTELVNALADELRRQSVPHPMIEAWNVVGTPDPKEFPKKLQPGQPLGDLTQEAVINAFMPLVLSRLKYYGAAGNEDAKQAALVGLLNASASYDPAVDASVGTFASLYRHIDDAIKYEISGKEGDAWSKNNVDVDAAVTIGGKESDDAPENDGSLWGVIPNTYLPDQIADGLDRSRDKQNRPHHSRIPFWVQAWSDQTHVRCEFGAREEDWMDLPCAPQDMADALAKIPTDKVGRGLGKLNEQEREIVTARFYRKPPILLSEIARGELNLKSKTSYKEVLNIAYRAVVKIAGQFEVKRPIRRPERLPDPPRLLSLKPPRPLTPLQKLERCISVTLSKRLSGNIARPLLTKQRDRKKRPNLLNVIVKRGNGCGRNILPGRRNRIAVWICPSFVTKRSNRASGVEPSNMTCARNISNRFMASWKKCFRHRHRRQNQQRSSNVTHLGPLISLMMITTRIITLISSPGNSRNN